MNKILIISNNPQLSSRLKACLAGAEVQFSPDAKSSKEAIESYGHEKPAIAVIDLFLGPTTGLELLKTLKKADEHLRVILISEMRTKAVLERGFRYGADDILTVPFKDSTFVACVLHRLGNEF